jgi:Sulfotransferase family
VATRPILLLSLPRSGSTLVQRVLGTYDEVATASEPWLLLPLLLPLRDDVPAPGGWQPGIHEALADFTGTLPGGVGAYERAVGDAARAIYDEAAGGAPLFLDKTPPYFLVVEEIVRALPEARIVILWRNPLAVLSSVVETFCGGRWRPQDYPTSLFGGLARLIGAARRHGERIHTVRYEDLVGGDDAEWRRLTAHLGLEFDPASLRSFSEVRLEGAMGDKAGTGAYSGLATEPTEKWRRTIDNPVRRLWARRYLEWIGAERLALMGYDLERLLGELAGAEAHLSGSAVDAAEALRSIARDAAKARFARAMAGPSAWPALWGGAPTGGGS